MRALSLKQPWVYAIFRLDKMIENRTWKPPDRIIGQRIALHASKTIDHAGYQVIKDIIGTFPPTNLPRGAVVGSVRIVGWMHESGQGKVPDPCMGHLIDDKWFFGPYGWILDKPLVFGQPIPARGSLGLWEWTYE